MDTKLKSTHKKNLILVDADGVLLDWEFAFSIWMEEHGFVKREGHQFEYDIGVRYGIDRDQSFKLIKMFNESAAIGFLPPLRDAMYYVKRLHEEHGYVFHCITSLSTDVNAGRLREMNLRKLFGRTAFEGVTCLATGADKTSALESYAGSGLWWFEDKIENAIVGHEMGLNSVLVEHGHNMTFEHPNIPRVKNWKEIYHLITD
jgi:FMN phosphatase YigB (HAD superfamily)